MVASCVREAVKEAVQKQDGTLPSRSVASRLKERHLTVEKLASELSKIKSLKTDEKTLNGKLNAVLSNSLYASFLLAAAELDDDVKKGAIPLEFGDVAHVSRGFGNLICEGKRLPVKTGLDEVDLPPFLRQALFSILQSEQS
jgi:hypothetical protein